MSASTTVKLSIIDAIFTLNGAVDKSVADVSLKCTVGEAKANTRNSRHELSVPSMFVDEVEVSYPSDSASGGLAALILAFTTCAAVTVSVSDGAGMKTFNMTAGVFGWDDTQTLNEVPVNKFTLKPYAMGAGGPFPSFS